MKNYKNIQIFKALGIMLLALISLACAADPQVPQDTVHKDESPYHYIYEVFRLLPNSVFPEHKEKTLEWCAEQTKLLLEIEEGLKAKALPADDEIIEPLKKVNALLKEYIIKVVGKKNHLTFFEYYHIRYDFSRNLVHLRHYIQGRAKSEPAFLPLLTFTNNMVEKFIDQNQIRTRPLWKELLIFFGTLTAAIIIPLYISDKWEQRKLNTIDLTGNNLIVLPQKEVDQLGSLDEDDVKDQLKPKSNLIKYVLNIGKLRIILSDDEVKESNFLKAALKGKFKEAQKKQISPVLLDQLKFDRESWTTILLWLKEAASLRKMGCSKEVIIDRVAMNMNLNFDTIMLTIEALKILDVSEETFRAVFHYCFKKWAFTANIGQIFLKIEKNSTASDYFKEEYKSVFGRDLLITVKNYKEANNIVWESVQIENGVLDLSLKSLSLRVNAANQVINAVANILQAIQNQNQVHNIKHPEITSLEELEDIPEDVRKKVTKIDLSHQKLIKVDSCAFRLFPNLKEIDLTNCSIGQLHPEAFFQLPNLKKVNIKDLWIGQGNIKEALPIMCRID